MNSPEGKIFFYLLSKTIAVDDEQTNFIYEHIKNKVALQEKAKAEAGEAQINLKQKRPGKAARTRKKTVVNLVEQPNLKEK